MPHLVSPSLRAASALRRAEKALRNWQDDPCSPRNDVDKMLTIISDLRAWVQGHVLADIERAERSLRAEAGAGSDSALPPSKEASGPEGSDHYPRFGP